MSNNFNLLPKEVFEVRQKSRKAIDRTTLFSALLPLFAVVVWIVFIIINSLTQTSLLTIENNITQTEREIITYQLDKDKKALLVLKTRVLKDIVRRDVNPENFFNVVQDLIDESGLDIQILTYGRNTDGKFYINATSDSLPSVADLNRIFKRDDLIVDVQLHSVLIENSENNRVSFEISFNITDL